MAEHVADLERENERLRAVLARLVNWTTLQGRFCLGCNGHDSCSRFV